MDESAPKPVIMPDASDSKLESIFPWLSDTPHHFDLYSAPEGRAKAAAWSVGVVAALHGLYILGVGAAWGLRGIEGFNQTSQSVAGMAVGLLGISSLPAMLVSVVLVIRWQRVTIRNTMYFGCARPSPGVTFASFSWFIPFANLWYPYKSIREAAQYGEGGRPDLRWELVGWWTLWILGQTLNSSSQSMVRQAGHVTEAATVVDILGSALLALAGILLIRVIREITARHGKRRLEVEAAEAFA